jgi:hypothetical protein
MEELADLTVQKGFYDPNCRDAANRLCGDLRIHVMAALLKIKHNMGRGMGSSGLGDMP